MQQIIVGPRYLSSEHWSAVLPPRSRDDLVVRNCCESVAWADSSALPAWSQRAEKVGRGHAGICWDATRMVGTEADESAPSSCWIPGGCVFLRSPSLRSGGVHPGTKSSREARLPKTNRCASASLLRDLSAKERR